MLRRVVGAVLLWGALAGAGPRVEAQESGGEGTTGVPTPALLPRAAVNAIPQLRRTISLDLRGASVDDALKAVARRSDLAITYNDAILPKGKRIWITAEEIRTDAALERILQDSGLQLLPLATGQVVVVKSRRIVDRKEMGIVSGRVTDAKNGNALGSVEVWLDGTKHRASTNDQGFYRLADVPAGPYTLVARRVGYAKQSRAVTVTAQGESVVDLALQPVVTQLDELVTTVTGEQRARELGHVVGRINADSVVREAPVSSLSELLSARVAGLQVYQNQGTVGGTVKLQSRGPNSFYLSNEPIIIVDGVRYTSAYVKKRLPYPFVQGLTDVEPTSPLNDLNPNDIETVEVVKGPSAATLYGTDAANGVIVVTTKRGKPGPAQWRAYGKAQRMAIPTPHFEDPVRSWGHTVPGNAPTTCTLQDEPYGYCVMDSITTLTNPLNDPDWSMLTARPAWNYGASVGGGRQDLRYFFAADVDDADGPARIPPALARRLLARRGTTSLTDEEEKPNVTSQVSLRANVSADLGRAAEARVNVGYVRGATRRLEQSYNAYGASLSSDTVPYGSYGFGPAEIFTSHSTERLDRFVGSANGQWRPASWLSTRATLGLDLTGRSQYSLTPTGYGVGSSGSPGAVEDNRLRQMSLTGDLGLTAMARRGRMTFRTSLGAQYVRSVSDHLLASGQSLPPGGTSVGEAGSVYATQVYNETVTLGSYLEETIGLNDRLFFTGAVRADGASAFGQNYDVATYPKVSASWIISEEPFMPRLPGLDELRLRFAHGVSGQQPSPTWARVSYSPLRGTVDGNYQSMVTVASVGNPNLRPQRVRENEFGLDASAFRQRVRLGLTWYQRRTSDQIINVTLGPGFGNVYTNIGLTSQHGFEAELTVTPLDTRRLSLDLIAKHGLHRTKLEDLGRAFEFPYAFGAWVTGYPLGARFQRPVSYEDVNNDGLIAYNELRLGAQQYVGEGTPPVAQTLTAVIGLLDRKVRVSALFERRYGYAQINGYSTVSRCGNGCDHDTPLQTQALALAAMYGSYYDIQDGDFTRFRELAVAFDVPAAVARAFRVRSGTVSFSARNLALWTSFTGPDPESAAIGGTSADGGYLVSGGMANGIPQGRTWSLRVDLGL